MVVIAVLAPHTPNTPHTHTHHTRLGCDLLRLLGVVPPVMPGGLPDHGRGPARVHPPLLRAVQQEPGTESNTALQHGGNLAIALPVVAFRFHFVSFVSFVRAF